MKAVFFRGKDLPLVVKETYKPIPSPKQVLIRLHYAAINRRDLWIVKEQANLFKDGIILGSDGCGVVEEVGAEADGSWIGKEVVISPGFNWGDNPLVQSDSFKILGFPDPGTFAEYIAVPKESIVEKPEHLSSAEAAAIPLSGLTAYRALFSKARLRPGEKVLVSGVGGGSAHWALKLALAFKARVYVTSGSDAKIQKAISLGASGGYNYNEEGWLAKATWGSGGFDIIIDGTAGNYFASLLELARPGGRVVLFGRTAGNMDGIIPRSIFFKQLTISGTTLGTRDEFLSLLDFIEKHKIKPEIDRMFSLERTEEALQYLEEPERFGKIVLETSPPAPLPGGGEGS
jgi:zinc-binding alcohol dehydrogenase/oxidoreductase